MAKKIMVEIVGDASSLTRAFKQADNSGNTLGSRLATVGKIAAGGFAVGIVAGTYALKKSFDAAIDAEKAQTRLDTAFKAASVSAKDRAAGLEAVAAVSRKAALDDEDLMDSLGRLTRVTGDAAKARTDLAIAADLARARGIELEAATQIVTKAELGQLGALKRIGIEIPKVTTAQDALRDSGEKVTATEMKAAKARDEAATRLSAVAALQRQYAGASEAYGNTAAGAQDRFRVAVENLQEALGMKLLPVFARVAEWVTVNMPQIEAVVTGVTGRIGDAFDKLAAVAERAWPRIKVAAEQVSNWYRNNLEPTITSVTKNISAAWERAGVDSKESAQRNFGGIPPLIKMLLQNTMSTVNAALALLRGDWSQAWNEMKVIPGRALTAVVDTIKSFKGVADAAAKAVGDAVVAGFKKGVVPLVSAVSERLGQLKSAVADAASGAYNAAVGIGRAIINGVLDGLSGLFNAVKNKISGILGSALSSIDVPGFSPVDQAARKAIGEPIIKGAIAGLDAMAGTFNAKTSKVTKDAVMVAAQAVREGRSDYRQAWKDYVEEALGAFDEVSGKLLTKTEKLIADLAAKQERAAPRVELTEATAALDTAKLNASWNKVMLPDETVDQWIARVAAANQELIAAQARFDAAKLALQAQTERAALNQRIAADKTNFQQWLASRTIEQQQAIIQEGKGQAQIVKKINSYGPDYRAAGKALGDSIARGLRDAAGNVVDAANELAAAIAKSLGVAAQIGKTAADNAGNRLKEVQKRAGGGPVRAGTPYIVGEQGPEIFWPGLSGAVIPNANTAGAVGLAGGGGITINFPNYVGNRDELIQEVRRGLYDVARRNPGALPGVA